MELINGVVVEQIGPEGPRIYQRPPDKTSIIFFLKAQAGWVEVPKHDDDDELTDLERELAGFLKEARLEYGTSSALPVQPGAIPVSDEIDRQDQCV